MSKILIVGGGFAGLASAVYLSKLNHHITLLEASPKLGGRAYSFHVEEKNDCVDNGQHVLMGCYFHTLDFLHELGMLGKLFFQTSLELNLIEKGGTILKLGSKSRAYPFNLLQAMFSFPRFNTKDKIALLKFFMKLPFTTAGRLRNLSVHDWLTGTNQTENTFKYFWNLLIVGALNTDAVKASATVFREILITMFFRGNKASTIVIPVTDLSDLYCNASREYLKKYGNEIRLGERVEGFAVKNNKIIGVKTNKNTYSGYDFVISAIPLNQYIRIENNGLPSEMNLEHEYSPILSVHLWIKNFKFEKKFYGFIDSFIHWLFVHEKHITIVTSNAVELINLPNDEIIRRTASEISQYFPGFSKKQLIDALVIKEKRATFISSKKFEEVRKTIKSPYENLVFAGDWTNTELPSTIESAVKSGKTAVDEIRRLIG